MSSFSSKLLIACLLIGFGIFFGIEMTRNGIEQINGPLEHERPEVTNFTVKHIEKSESDGSGVDADEQAVIAQQALRPAMPDKAIHRMANKTEKLIETSLQEGVELIVSLFEVIVH